MRILKSITARKLFREFPWLQRRLWYGEMWNDGYFARTVGDRMTSEIVKKHIQNHRDLEQGPTQLHLKLREGESCTQDAPSLAAGSLTQCRQVRQTVRRMP